MSVSLEKKYVVTFNPAPVVGVGAVDGLRRMSLANARKLQRFAASWRRGRIFNVATLEEVA